MRVEIYVEAIKNSGVYERLDLFGDENITVTSKYKDASDLSKVYSPYSQSFTIPADKENTRLLNYFFNTEVSRNSNRYLRAKIYIAQQLYKVGNISLEQGNFKKFRQSNYTIRFFTSAVTLKDKFGDALLSEYLVQEPDDKVTTEPEVYSFNYTHHNLHRHLQGRPADFYGNPQTLQDYVIVPFASNSRVVYYDTFLEPEPQTDNVKYFGSSTRSSALRANEVRPAIRHLDIMKAIARRADLEFDIDIINEHFYQNKYVWLNGKGAKTNFVLPIVESSFNDYPTLGWTVRATADTNFYEVGRNDIFGNTSSIVFSADIALMGVFTQTNISDTIIDVNYYYIHEGKRVDIQSLNLSVYSAVDDYHSFRDTTGLVLSYNLFNSLIDIVGGQTLKIYFDFSATDVLDYKLFGSSISVYKFNVRPLNFLRKNILDDTIPNDLLANLYTLLPEIKVVDFITSFLKCYNAIVLEDDINPKKLNFLSGGINNQEEIEKVDITRFVDINTHTVKPYDLYKKLVFKHFASNLYSNTAFRTAPTNTTKRDFGETNFISDDTNLKSDYIIETKYTITPTREVEGLFSFLTMYGFDYDASITNNRYKANTKELIVFEYNGTKTILKPNPDITSSALLVSTQLAFIVQAEVLPLSTYCYCDFGFLGVFDPLTGVYLEEQSLAFGEEVSTSITTSSDYVHTETLYKSFYERFIEKTYNTNGRLFTFKCWLDAETIIKLGYEKLVRIEDRLFNLEETSINIVTGESTLVLSNVKVPDNTNWDYEEIVVPNEPPLKPSGIQAIQI